MNRLPKKLKNKNRNNVKEKWKMNKIKSIVDNLKKKKRKKKKREMKRHIQISSSSDFALSTIGPNASLFFSPRFGFLDPRWTCAMPTLGSILCYHETFSARWGKNLWMYKGRRLMKRLLKKCHWVHFLIIISM